MSAVEAPLSLYNYANLAAFVVNAIGFALSLVTTVFGEKNNDLSEKYQTLVTPNTSAFRMWTMISVSQFAFVVAQMTPSLRNSPLVPVITPWWCAIVGFQFLWFIVFGQEAMGFASFVIFCLLVSLIGLTQKVDRMPFTTKEFWLLRAPFSLHAAWMVAATLLNFNVWADKEKASSEFLIGLAAASLAGVLTATALLAVAAPRPDAIACLVSAWTTFYISQELDDPVKLKSQDKFNPQTWDDSTIGGISTAAWMVSYASLIFAGIAIVERFRRQRHVVEEDGGAEGVSMTLQNFKPNV